MRCADLSLALDHLEKKRGQPYQLTDEGGRVIQGMALEVGFEFLNKIKVPMALSRIEALDILTFMQGWITLAPLNAAAYIERSS